MSEFSAKPVGIWKELVLI